MTVSLFKDGQSQALSLPGYLASFLFYSLAKPITWQFYGHLSESAEIKSLDILNLKKFQEEGMNIVLLRALFVQWTLFLQPQTMASLLFRIW